MESFHIQYLELKKILYTNVKWISILCVLGILVGGTILTTGVATPSIQDQLQDTTEPIPEKTHQITLQYDEQAEITEDTPLYSNGDTISNNSLYPLSASNFTVETTAATKNITVTSLENEFVYRGVKRTDASEQVWEKESNESLTEKTTPTLSRMNLEIDEIQNKIDNYRDVYSTAVNIRPQLQTTVKYKYESPTGETFNRQFTTTGDLQFVENGYQINYSNTENIHTTGGIDQSNDVSFLNIILSVTVGSFVVVLISTLLVKRSADPMKLSQKIKQLRYSEWITEVESFQSATSNIMMTHSLEDLVLLAIDVQSRVIHVNQTDEYFVIDGPVVYGYTEHGDSNSPPRAATFGMHQTREQADELEELEDTFFSIDSTNSDNKVNKGSDPFTSKTESQDKTPDDTEEFNFEEPEEADTDDSKDDPNTEE